MTDRRKLDLKPGQHLGKRVRNPKKRKKTSEINPSISRARSIEPLAEWERELLGINTPRRRNPRRA